MNNLLKIVKKHYNSLLIVAIAVLIVVVIVNKYHVVENYMSCDEVKPKQDIGETAKDACNKISSRAEEIASQYKGAAEIIQAAQGPFNPKNYRSGDNITNSMVRNIINNSLSTCDITKIEQSCANTITDTQLNEIDNSKCPFCILNRCDAIGNKQVNVSDLIQKCTIQSGVSALLKKSDDIEAQALARAIQKAEGILSGDNHINSENCNVVDNSQTAKSYLENISKCSNDISTDQRNSLTVCGSALDNVQSNKSIKLQECIIGTKIDKSVDTATKTKLKSELTIDQTTTGIAMGIGSLISFCCFCISLSILLAAGRQANS